MKLADLMTRNVETISPLATIEDAARKMKCFDVGILPVCDGKELLGVLTARDIAIRVAAEGQSPSETTVQAAMTPYVVCCHVDDDVKRAVKIMGDRHIHRLIVVDHGNLLAGVVSMRDVATRATDEEAVAAMVRDMARRYQSAL